MVTVPCYVKINLGETMKQKTLPHRVLQTLRR